MKSENSIHSNQNITNQLVRGYRVPVENGRMDALDTILYQINNQKETAEKPQFKLSPAFFVKLAAIFIVLVLALHFITATVIFSGKNGECQTCRLPDHSRVVLQNDSYIKFSKYFGNRKIALDGTAYFEVEKGSKFKVKTKLGKVEVLGTHFLVSEQNDSLNVMCYDGLVKTIANDNSFILEPGTKYTGTKDSGEKAAMQTLREYPDFAKFNKSFPNIALNKVIQDIESFFGVQIDIQNGKERSFSGTIQTGKLESALEIVCQSMQLKYKYANKYRIVIF